MSGLFFRGAFPLAVIVVLNSPVLASNLLDTYRAALQNDPIFLSAEYRQLVAAEARPKARSTLLPQIDFGANIAHNNLAGDFGSEGIDLTLTQSIYRQANYITLSQADLQIKQADAEYNAPLVHR